MKVFRKLAWGLLFVVAASLTGATTVMAQSRMYGSVNSFYDDLAPYGRWINSIEFGEAWVPNVERGFQPYATRGHWVMTEFGNTWVSDYEWGWAPFHYGRWTFDDYYGQWIWIPDNQWGPAWVNWRSDNDYYGWAPLGPGVNININIPSARWIFVPKRYFMTSNVYNYCVPRERVVYVYRNTTVINNIYVNGNRRYASGPYRDDIERNTRQRVNVYRIDNYDRPSRTIEHDGSLRVYRPENRERSGRYSDYNDRRDDNRYRRDNSDNRPYGNSPDRNNSKPDTWNGSRDDGNSSRSRDYNQERDRSQNERYGRQQNEGQGRMTPNPSAGSSSSDQPRTRPETQPNNSGGSYNRPERSRDNSSPSSRGENNPGSRERSSTDEGNSNSNGNAGDSRRSRPVRG